MNENISRIRFYVHDENDRVEISISRDTDRGKPYGEWHLTYRNANLFGKAWKKTRAYESFREASEAVRAYMKRRNFELHFHVDSISGEKMLSYVVEYNPKTAAKKQAEFEERWKQRQIKSIRTNVDNWFGTAINELKQTIDYLEGYRSGFLSDYDSGEKHTYNSPASYIDWAASKLAALPSRVNLNNIVTLTREMTKVGK